MENDEIVGFRNIDSTKEQRLLNQDDVKKAIEFKEIIMGLDRAGDQLKNINEKINFMLKNNSTDKEFVSKVRKIQNRINELINYQTELMINENINQVGNSKDTKID